jgi:regulatory protein YycH of two-component signal transduction system YycFG
LDLSYLTSNTAEVLWSNYKKDIGAWQGALQNKESYMRTFLALKSITLKESNYHIEKIERVLDALIEKAIILVSKNRDGDND